MGEAMRDPALIDQMIEVLWETWRRNPDMRPGQLIMVAVRPSEPCPEVFYIEDTVLARRLERLGKRTHDDSTTHFPKG